MSDSQTDHAVRAQAGEPSGRAARGDELRRAIMERARLSAERDRQKPPRRTLQHAIALAAALVVVGTLVFGFDAFLASMQKVMRLLDEDEARQQSEQALPRPDEPIPAYVVPTD
jgi:hypothetical protein